MGQNLWCLWCHICVVIHIHETHLFSCSRTVTGFFDPLPYMVWNMVPNLHFRIIANGSLLRLWGNGSRCFINLLVLPILGFIGMICRFAMFFFYFNRKFTKQCQDAWDPSIMWSLPTNILQPSGIQLYLKKFFFCEPNFWGQVNDFRQLRSRNGCSGTAKKWWNSQIVNDCFSHSCNWYWSTCDYEFHHPHEFWIYMKSTYFHIYMNTLGCMVWSQLH